MQEFEIEQYLAAVCSQIRNRKVHAAIRKELHAHIEDKTDYYKSMGMDDSAAVIKTIESMGNPIETGKQLNKEHKGKLYLIITAAAIACVFLIGVLAYPFIMRLVYTYEVTRDLPYHFSINTKDTEFDVTVLGNKRIESSNNNIRHENISYVQAINEDTLTQKDTAKGVNSVKAIVIYEEQIENQMQSNIDVLRKAVENGYFIYIIGSDKTKADILFMLLSGDLTLMNPSSENSPPDISDFYEFEDSPQQTHPDFEYSFIYKDESNIYNYYTGNQSPLQSLWDFRFKIAYDYSNDILKAQKRQTDAMKLSYDEIISCKSTDFEWYECPYFEWYECPYSEGILTFVRSYIYVYESNKYTYYILKHTLELIPNNTSGTDRENILRNFTFTISVPSEFTYCDYNSEYNIPTTAQLAENRITLSTLDAYSKGTLQNNENLLDFFVNHKYGTNFAKSSSEYNMFTVLKTEKKDSSTIDKFNYSYTLKVNTTKLNDEIEGGYTFFIENGKIFDTHVE